MTVQSRVCSVKRAGLKSFVQLLSEQLDFPRSFEYIDNLFNCTRDEMSMEARYEEGGLVPDSMFKHLDKYLVSDMALACNSALNLSFKRFKSENNIRRATVAIDINESEYWGREDEYVHYKRGKGKNSHYLRYATVSLVDTRMKCTIAVLPIKKEDDNLCVVDELLRQASRLVEVDYVLLDRGFYDYRIMKTIDERGMIYIIPFRRTMGVKNYVEALDGDRAQMPYTLNRVQPYRYTTQLYIKKDQSPEGYSGVVSNKHVTEEMIDWILEYYMKRWNIENTYKEINHYRVKTSSPKKQYRLLLYVLAHLLVNTIQQIRTANGVHVRYYEFKKMIPILLGIITGPLKISRTLTVQP